jgi:hypothetical protein
MDSAKTANWRPIAPVLEASARRLIVRMREVWEEDLERQTSVRTAIVRRQLVPQGNKISAVEAIAAMAAAHPHHQRALPIRRAQPSIDLLLRVLRKVGAVAVAGLSRARAPVEGKSVLPAVEVVPASEVEAVPRAEDVRPNPQEHR